MSDVTTLYEAARESDADRAFLALFLPPKVRETALALLLFNAELARIPGAVKDPAAGLFRFQFWREAILGDAASPAVWAAKLRQDVAEGLIDGDDLAQLIDGRALLLDGLPDASLTAIENFAKETAGLLQRLQAGLLTSDERFLHSAAKAGTAYGLAGIRPALAAQLAAGRPLWPEDALGQSGWRPDKPLDESVERELAQATLPLLARGLELTSEVKSARPPRALFGVLALRQVAAVQIGLQNRHPGRLSAAQDNPPWLAPYMAMRWLLNRP